MSDHSVHGDQQGGAGSKSGHSSGRRLGQEWVGARGGGECGPNDFV
jgi:hypothetical protein